MDLKGYYAYVFIIASLLTLIFLSVFPVVPVGDEELAGISPTGVRYNLSLPVGVSFSTFLALMLFFISIVIFYGTKSTFYNVLIDSSGISFVFLNYFNYYLIYETWKPEIMILPFLIEITFNGAKTLVIDLGQIVLIVILYRAYKMIRTNKS
jgi:hypothetical protein